MSLKQSAKYMFPKVHPEGIKFVSIFFAITVLLFVLSEVLGWIGLILTIFCTYFFRNPERFSPDRDDVIISPADGTVCSISESTLPEELEDESDELYTKVCVFMSVFNVHVNRNPISGKLLKNVYVPGKFINAELDKASKHNERNIFLVETKDKKKVAHVQIAGLIARRIMWWVKEEDELTIGKRFGLIRFGSRLDVYIPSNYKVNVKEGQTMIAGESILAEEA